MKAVLINRYGSPQKVLSIGDIDIPSPTKNEVCIQVQATTINDYDWIMTRGRPRILRLMFGLTKPKRTVAGMECAGVVCGVGSGVTQFKVGDPVFGDISENMAIREGSGTFAEYLCISQDSVILRPKSIPPQEAAALPHAACLAFQALRDLAGIKNAEKVLINGGGGGVGIMGLQIAKYHQCQVTGVDSGAKLPTMTSLGYDRVIDYTQHDITRMKEKYDLVLDCKTNRHPLHYLRILRPRGRYVTVGGKLTSLLSMLIWGKLIRPLVGKKLRILSLKPNHGLDEIIQLYHNKHIKCYIDGPHAFEDIPALVDYFGHGRHTGKIVIKL